MAWRVLILGGTTEGRQLAAALAADRRFAATVSLAGRTEVAVPHAVPVRSGGFGGATGLADHLRDARIDMLVDATHPFATRISRNAVMAAADTGVALLALRRPPWVAGEGDRWTEVADIAAAVAALGEAPRRVFLALGRNEVAAFEAAPQHAYLIRSVEPIAPPLALPQAEYLVARGPFAEADELALLEQHRIETVVSRNSGGAAAYGKIAAARRLGLPVVMIARPALPDVPAVASVAEAVAWLAHAGTAAEARGV
jgi:precorrin-6A/cobalt-precorrin-6A reductase